MTNVLKCFSRSISKNHGISASARRAGKILLCSALAFALLLSATACQKKKSPFEELSNIELSSFDKCPVELSVEVVWNRKVSVTLTNKGDTSYLYGSSYNLEYKHSGKWYRVPFLSHTGFTLEAYTLGHGETVTFGDEEYTISNTTEMTYYLDEMHGELPAGHYRIVKEIFPDSSSDTEYWIAGEFDLDKATSEEEPLQKSKVDPSQVIPADQSTLNLTSLDYDRKENNLVVLYSADVQFILEVQKDGQWYNIPIRGFGGYYDASAVDQQIEIHPERELAPGHYRLLRDDYMLGVAPEDSPSRYLTYEFDIV